MNFLTIVTGITSVLTLGAFIFGIYFYFRNPDIKAKGRLDLLEQGCEMKHEGISENIASINSSIKLIHENHLKHIEYNINGLEKKMTKVLTILEERERREK